MRGRRCFAITLPAARDARQSKPGIALKHETRRETSPVIHDFNLNMLDRRGRTRVAAVWTHRNTFVVGPVHNSLCAHSDMAGIPVLQAVQNGIAQEFIQHKCDERGALAAHVYLCVCRVNGNPFVPGQKVSHRDVCNAARNLCHGRAPHARTGSSGVLGKQVVGRTQALDL